MLQDSSNRDVVILIVALSLSQLNCQYAKAAIRQGRQDESVVTMEDIQRLGEASLDEATRSYIASGADREQTLRENTAAFSRLRFRPRSLVDVSRIHTATTVLGRRISFPVGFSPSAAHKIAHEDGEFGTAKAARDAGTVMIVSAMSTASMEEIRASVPDCLLWQQMYIFRNRSLTESMARRAAHQGFAAIVVTVDSPVAGQAVSLSKNMFVLPEGLRFANLEASWPDRSFTFEPSKEDFVGNLLSSSATWEDFRWLRGLTPLPLVAKGVMTGVPDVRNLCTDLVVREPYYSQPLHRNCAPKHPWGDWVQYKIAK
ncbi:hypothetical protein HPB50_022417 [Hyalomma asiaticum]|uniref:Uncharacterized protein n=1 Tax=Hyalomma asiaticum TaxID=266040 RepID=A0ACB7TF91_HYAAI|nr:hypothetical protein HPB50_022417 [Hyalomma asiaticum]